MLDFIAPGSGDPLRPVDGALSAPDGHTYPIVDGIPRFVGSESYAASFGLEWNVHAHTQLDSRLTASISKERLERCIGDPVDSLRGKRVLEAGCGAGRFSERLVEAGALTHCFDLSSAVDANRRNIGERANYVIAQADILSPPFPAGAFDVVLCLGVLQHTPSPEASIRSLWRMVKPGGQLVIDHYTWDLSRVTQLDPLYRAVLKRLQPERAYRIISVLVRFFFRIHWAVRRHFIAQAILSRISPCYVYMRAFPELTRAQHEDLCRLDTFDHLTDRYKRLRTRGQIRRTLESLGATDVKVWKGGNGVEGRCRKPNATPPDDS